MKDKVQQSMQTFSRSIIQPVMFLTVTGLVIGLSVIFRLEQMPELLRSVGDYLYNLMMNGTMNQLSLIFCVGITSAIANRKKTDAAILGVIVFLTFIYANNAWLAITKSLAEATDFGLYGTGQTMTLGVQTIDMGVLLGILLGVITGYIFNKFSEVEFNDVFRIYGGTRFVYMLMIPVTVFLAIVLSYVWPVMNEVITSSAEFMSNAGSLGVFVYGFLNRFLIPTGLHHLVYMPFMFTPLGGTTEIMGEFVSGATFIWNEQLGHLGQLTELHDSARFMTYGFSKIFGTIGIALAFIKTAKPEKKEQTKGILIPSLFVAVLAGITEPFEFAFLFISPLLWMVHSVLDGIFQTILYLVNVRISMGSGIIALITGNLPVPIRLSNIHIALIVGAIGTAVWYFSFTYLIEKLDIKTPGREDEGAINFNTKEKSTHESKETNLSSNGLGDITDIVEGLGGATNIKTLNNCFTRLRVNVKDPELIDESTINNFDNSGIVKNGNNIQIIIGMKVGEVREDIAELLNLDG